MAESDELTPREKKNFCNKEGGKYIAIDGKSLKSHQVCGLSVITLVKRVVKHSSNVTHFTPTENTTVKGWKQKK